MSEPDVTITLIGSRLAAPGNEFIYRGPAADCEKCKLKNICLNLDKNKKYRVTGVRNGSELECALHDTGVKAVEVVACPIITVMESRKAFNGSKMTYEAPDCDKSCECFALCHPEGLATGEKYTICEVFSEEIGPCQKGLTLKKVELRP